MIFLSSITLPTSVLEMDVIVTDDLCSPVLESEESPLFGSLDFVPPAGAVLECGLYMTDPLLLSVLLAPHISLELTGLLVELNTEV